MLVGLQQHRAEHPRLALFANALNLFADAPKVEVPVLLGTFELLALLLRLLGQDRMLTAVTTADFFHRYRGSGVPLVCP
jgi:hypothetical protein